MSVFYDFLCVWVVVLLMGCPVPVGVSVLVYVCGGGLVLVGAVW